MATLHQFGISASGLMSQKLRDLDAGTARPPLPPRALPDDVRRRLKLPERTADYERVLPMISAPKSKPSRFSSIPDPIAESKQRKKTSPYLMASPFLFSGSMTDL